VTLVSLGNGNFQGTWIPTVPGVIPAQGISSAVNAVTMTIGGINATVLFAGLTPGFPGLYQVNAVVPAGVSASDQVPVVLSVSGNQSNSAPVSVRTP
jgi:adhesin/invasin